MMTVKMKRSRYLLQLYNKKGYPLNRDALFLLKQIKNEKPKQIRYL